MNPSEGREEEEGEEPHRYTIFFCAVRAGTAFNDADTVIGEPGRGGKKWGGGRGGKQGKRPAMRSKVFKARRPIKPGQSRFTVSLLGEGPRERKGERGKDSSPDLSDECRTARGCENQSFGDFTCFRGPAGQEEGRGGKEEKLTVIGCRSNLIVRDVRVQGWCCLPRFKLEQIEYNQLCRRKKKKKGIEGIPAPSAARCA